MKELRSKITMFLIVVFIIFTLFTCASRERIGCHCWDGTDSGAKSRGACSHHKGVMYWKHEYWWDK